MTAELDDEKEYCQYQWTNDGKAGAPRGNRFAQALANEMCTGSSRLIDGPIKWNQINPNHIYGQYPKTFPFWTLWQWSPPSARNKNTQFQLRYSIIMIIIICVCVWALAIIQITSRTKPPRHDLLLRLHLPRQSWITLFINKMKTIKFKRFSRVENRKNKAREK